MTFKSVTLKNTQTEPQKSIIFLRQINNNFASVDEIKKKMKCFFFFSPFRKITAGVFLNQILKNSDLMKFIQKSIRLYAGSSGQASR